MEYKIVEWSIKWSIDFDIPLIKLLLGAGSPDCNGGIKNDFTSPLKMSCGSHEM